ncbi:site-specific tyrosine recombinase XerS [compost metagenome]
MTIIAVHEEHLCLTNEKLIEKYASAFGKPALTVHSLRHSFATRYHLENINVPRLKNNLY